MRNYTCGAEGQMTVHRSNLDQDRRPIGRQLARAERDSVRAAYNHAEHQQQHLTHVSDRPCWCRAIHQRL